MTRGKPELSLGERTAAMVEFGLSPSIVSAIASAFMPDRLTLDEHRWLDGPVIVHQNGWTETLPEWMPAQVRAERVRIVFDRNSRFIVGHTELAAVMYPATLEHPLGRDLSDLYVWAAGHAAAMHRKQDPQAFFREIAQEMIPDAWLFEPRGRLYEHYRRLATEIRARVVRVQAERERQERRDAGVAPPTPSERGLDAGVEQLVLFP